MTQTDWVTPFMQVDPCPGFRSIHLMGNWTKVFQDSMSQHNVTNPDQLKLVTWNYNRKICNTKIFKVQNFGRKNFDDSRCTRQIRQTFPPSKFYAMQYLLNILLPKNQPSILLRKINSILYNLYNKSTQYFVVNKPTW